MSARLLVAAGAASLALPVAVAAAATQTIAVTSVTVSMKAHDIGPKGASKGDTIVYRDRLVNATAQFGRKKGVVVGADSGTMTFTSAHTAIFKGKAVLPGGTLTLYGPVYSTADGLVVPVTGGTGVFAHVHGTLLVGAGKDRVARIRTTSRASPAPWPDAAPESVEARPSVSALEWGRMDACAYPSVRLSRCSRWRCSRPPARRRRR